MMTKDEHIRVYVSPETKRKIQEEAGRQGLNPSPWMRMLAKRELPKEVEA